MTTVFLLFLGCGAPDSKGLGEDSGEGPSTSAHWIDADGDGYGAPGEPEYFSLPAPAGYVDNDRDCDDGDSAVSPDGQEVCGGRDEDCDGLVDEADESLRYGEADLWMVDHDRDGWAGDNVIQACVRPESGVSDVGGDCDDDRMAVYPGAPEDCDGAPTRDSDCDGLVACEDGDCFGSESCSEGTAEHCDDGIDNDLDLLFDCEDDDCIALGGCLTVTTRLTGVELGRQDLYGHRWARWGRSFSNSARQYSLDWSLSQVEGVLSGTASDGLHWSCAWEVAHWTGHAEYSLEYWGSDTDSSVRTDSGEWTVASDCRLSTPALELLAPPALQMGRNWRHNPDNIEWSSGFLAMRAALWSDERTSWRDSSSRYTSHGSWPAAAGYIDVGYSEQRVITEWEFGSPWTETLWVGLPE